MKQIRWNWNFKIGFNEDLLLVEITSFFGFRWGHSLISFINETIICVHGLDFGLKMRLSRIEKNISYRFVLLRIFARTNPSVRSIDGEKCRTWRGKESKIRFFFKANNVSFERAQHFRGSSDVFKRDFCNENRDFGWFSSWISTFRFLLFFRSFSNRNECEFNRN